MSIIGSLGTFLSNRYKEQLARQNLADEQAIKKENRIEKTEKKVEKSKRLSKRERFRPQNSKEKMLKPQALFQIKALIVR